MKKIVSRFASLQVLYVRIIPLLLFSALAGIQFLSLAEANFMPPLPSLPSIYIRNDGSVDPTAPIKWVGDTYTFTGNIVDYTLEVQRDNIVIDGAGYTLQGNGSGTGIDLTHRNDVTIKNIEIRKFRQGIDCFNSSNNVITGNSIANNYIAIALHSSSNNQINGNNITENSQAILLYSSCNYNSIVENNITKNGEGIWCEGTTPPSNYTSIVRNNITENGRFAILIRASHSNTIVGNTITNNGNGISLDWSSSNTIIQNNITDNEHGIELCTQYDSEFYHNNFINNTQQVRNAMAETHTYTWDNGYPSGGNYWSDYAGEDANRDGIGDTPYIVNENNQDNYPLMEMRVREGVKFEPYVSTFDLLFEGGSHKLLGNLSGEIRITEPEKEIMRSVCKLSLSSPRPDEYHEPYIDKVELITAWVFIIHGWGPIEIPMYPPSPQKVTLHVDEEIILFEHSDDVSDFVEEPRIVFGFSRGKKIAPEWGAQILPTIRVYFSDGQKWEWEYEDNVTPPFKLWSGMDVNLSELGGKIETETITFTTVEKVRPLIIVHVRVIILASITVAIAAVAGYLFLKRKKLGVAK